MVTVQLPIYNELFVVERLIESVTKLDYPLDLMEIQVLDDSNDETRLLAKQCVERFRKAGFDIHYLHRQNRLGYKAGALEAGLKVAKGESWPSLTPISCPSPPSCAKPSIISPTPRSGWSRPDGDTSTPNTAFSPGPKP